MTTFVLSHNLQVQSKDVPAFQTQVLADGIVSNSSSIISAEVIEHPHWIIALTSNLPPNDMAVELVEAWKQLRSKPGQNVDHVILALGGRKDSPAAPGAPLQEGFWGVDVVETNDEKSFLQAINWDALKSNRPEDGVFEVSSNN
jgi:hypothetical protein